MAKKSPDQVFKEYQINYFCGSHLFPKSFYELDEEEQKEVARWIKEERAKETK